MKFVAIQNVIVNGKVVEALTEFESDNMSLVERGLCAVVSKTAPKPTPEPAKDKTLDAFMEDKAEESTPQTATDAVPSEAYGNEYEDAEESGDEAQLYTAVYKGRGWYDFDGKNVRRADLPTGCKIIKE